MPLFQQLWDNHPVIKGDAPLLDRKVYENQCAINLYAALQRAGFNVSTFRGTMSWQKNKPKYAIRAQELADWLASPGTIPSKVQKFSGKEVFDKIDEQKGIVFLQNYYGPGRQGDHIDLWNGSHFTDFWTSWPRIRLHIHWEGRWSDFRKAESAWFWRIL
jgi:hypothetical protein